MVNINIFRKALESLYKGRCNVYEYQKNFDPESKMTSYEEVMIFENIPCRLSYSKNFYFEKAGVTYESELLAEQANDIKLFISPDIKINPGSKIEVTQNGQTTLFTDATVARLYENHQEIKLKLFDKWGDYDR